MKARKGLGFALVMAALGMPAWAQGDGEKVFGAFRATCETDRMTDERKCNLSIQPDPHFFIDNDDLPVFLVFFYPERSDVSTVGFVRRLRVDKNPPLVGDCIATTSGLCLFKDKKENERFLKELATGTTVHVEAAGGRIVDFDLADYKKALASYEEMTKPVVSQNAN